MRPEHRTIGFILGACLVAAVAAGCQGKAGQSCAAGQTFCGGGTCANVATDHQNCGACGRACAANQVCQAGQCACGPSLLSCGSECVPSNASHCGNCTTVCTGT